MSKELAADKVSRVLRDDARRQILELFSHMIDTIGAKAVGNTETEPSLAHAKFILEMAELLGVQEKGDKNTRPAEEAQGPPPAELALPSWLANTMKTIDERIGDLSQHNSSAVK